MQSIPIDDDLELQPMTMRHLNALFDLIDEGRDYLRRWQNWPDNIRTLANMRTLIENTQRKAARRLGFDYVIVYRGEVAGKIGLVYIDWPRRKAEIGYWLGQDYQGHGLMTRSCRALVQHALVELDLQTVHIRCAVGNVRSAAIPQRLGFKSEGVLDRRAWVHDHLEDEALFSITRHDWRKRMIYHITDRESWYAAQQRGIYSAESLETQGFIHFSNLDQVIRVADAVYHGQTDLVLLCVEPGLLEADLRYEPPDPTIPLELYRGEFFPHLYGPLPVNAVLEVVAFPPEADGSFNLPIR